MLQVDKLSCELEDVTIFRDVSFSVAKGQALLITGANGAGKTTLLRVIAGLLPKASGEVSWSAPMQYLGHRPGLKADLTVVENLKLAAALYNVKPQSFNVLLEQVGLNAYADSFVYTLSRGQCQRLALARLLLSESQLWLLDEPLTALDVNAQKLVVSVIEQHICNGGLVVMTSHQALELARGELLHLHLGATASCA